MYCNNLYIYQYTDTFDRIYVSIYIDISIVKILLLYDEIAIGEILY